MSVNGSGVLSMVGHGVCAKGRRGKAAMLALFVHQQTMINSSRARTRGHDWVGGVGFALLILEFVCKQSLLLSAELPS